MTTARPTSLILLIGPESLQFAAMECFLRLWAVGNGLAIERASWDDGGELPPGVRLIVLCSGPEQMRGADMKLRLERFAQSPDGVPVVVLADSEDSSEIVSAFRSGARGYIPASCDPAVALKAISLILAGGAFFPPAALLSMMDSRHGGAPVAANGAGPDPQPQTGYNLGKATEGSAPDDAAPAGPQTAASPLGLTGRQQEVLDHLCRGASNKVIGRKLGMAEATVKVHVRQIMHKLGATNRTQVALRALGQGQTPAPPARPPSALFSHQAPYASGRSWFRAVQTIGAS